MGFQQMSIFEEMYDSYIIDKPIRLIELFSGIGAQAKALEKLGATFEHWKTCDWAVPSIHAYTAIHKKYLGEIPKESKIHTYGRKEINCLLQGVSSNYNSPMTAQQIGRKGDEWAIELLKSIYLSTNMVNVMDVTAEDLEIRDQDKYTYVMTYSFPCQDLSLAGNKKGMAVSQKEGGTRSGLLWEIERILLECECLKCLPQVLIMENVPEVIGQRNIKDFQKWRARLESLGYSNYCEILNAKDYGIPQNRRRCFMISTLGEYNFTFPRKRHLETTLMDFLEETVDPKYVLNQKMVDYLTGINQKPSKYDRGQVFERNLNPNKKVAATITCRAGERPTDNYIPIKNNNSKGYEDATIGDGIDISTRMQHHRGTVQKQSCQTITCMGGDNVGVVVEKKNLKQQLCDKLVEDGDVKPGDIVKHSYTTQILEGKKKGVEKSGEMITLTTRPDCVGVVVDAFSQTEKDLITEDGNIKRYLGSDKVDEFKEGQMATTTYPNGYGHGPRTHNESVALNTVDRPIVKKNLMIRKLTPLECLKLMGFEESDYKALREIGQTDIQIYHEAGDSIVVTVLMSIFGQLLGIDYEPIVDQYVASLKEQKGESNEKR